MSRAARRLRDDRVWQAGFLVGSALGVAATVVGRRTERSARRGLVDWPAVERIAIGRLRGAPGALLGGRAAREAEPAYAATMARIVPAPERGARDGAARRRRAGRASSTGPAGCGPTRPASPR